MRILPHHQDTGGFFVAVLEKSKILPWQKKPTPLSVPSPNPTTDHFPAPQEPQAELPGSPNQPSPTTKEETPVELLDPPDLSANQLQHPSPTKEKEAIEDDTDTTSNTTPEASSDPIVVKPPTAAAYNMYAILIVCIS